MLILSSSRLVINRCHSVAKCRFLLKAHLASLLATHFNVDPRWRVCETKRSCLSDADPQSFQAKVGEADSADSQIWDRRLEDATCHIRCLAGDIIATHYQRERRSSHNIHVSPRGPGISPFRGGSFTIHLALPNPQRTNLVFFSSTWRVDPKLSSSQTFTDRSRASLSPI